MKEMVCYQLQVVVPAGEADEFCDWVRLRLGKEPVSLTPPHGDRSVVDVYFETPEEAVTAKHRLPKQGLHVLSREVMRCGEERWTTFWRRHFHVMEMGKRLRTVPVWETPPKSKRIDLKIDPGLSFGTGGHFTTRFCLEELERAVEVLKPTSMLDAGAGSGILAIAAVKLGVSKVEGFDYDPVCVEKCMENAQLNGLKANRIHFYAQDVLGWQPKKRADVVCANILSSILIESASALWEATGRWLILSGIRDFEGDAVSEVFTGRGGREILRDGDGEWCGLVMERPMQNKPASHRRTKAAKQR